MKIYLVLISLIALCLIGSVIASIVGRRVTGKPFYEFSGFNVSMLGLMVLVYYSLSLLAINLGLGIVLLPLYVLDNDIVNILVIITSLPASVLVCLYSAKRISKNLWYRITTTVLLLLFLQLASLVFISPLI